mmetsp:Transcript_13689/g.23331  ORF Transcript_13689/g.23331 Transcript_13689/m.23331 type:complete len:207 (+) Transcript_13689:1314-1934(+)
MSRLRIRPRRILRKAEALLGREVQHQGGHLDSDGSHEGQEALPERLRHRRRVHLRLRRVLREHGAGDQRQHRDVRSGQEPVADADCAHEEPPVGLQRHRRQQQRNPTHRRQEHEQERGGAPVQREQQELEADAPHEPAAREPQVLLPAEQDLRDRRRLRHVLRGLRHQGEQVELHLLLQLAARQLPLLLQLRHRHRRVSLAPFGYK